MREPAFMQDSDSEKKLTIAPMEIGILSQPTRFISARSLSGAVSVIQGRFIAPRPVYFHVGDNHEEQRRSAAGSR